MIDKDKNQNHVRRREFLKALSTIPVFGGFLAAVWAKRIYDKEKKEALLSELGIDTRTSLLPDPKPASSQNLIRLGIIGTGSRGRSILQALGFTQSSDTDDNRHPDLNISLAGVCDVYDQHAEMGVALSRFNRYKKNASTLKAAKRYRNYQEMLSSPEIDAVIIATPDHWHTQMVIDATIAGKHVYCEKCLTRTIEEVYKVKEAVYNSSIVFQYGHQNRMQESYLIARQVLDKGILGKITLIKTHTNRNTPRGAWVRHLDKKVDRAALNWEEWLGDAPATPFTPSRYFGWQKFFEYSGGLPPHMFSHEYDAINQIMDLGIPESVTALGGIYYWKDDRNTPDVMQALFEYPDKELVLTYDATLACSSTGEYESGAKVKEIFGSDAWMKLGMNIYVVADRHSRRYEKKINDQLINPSLPFISYTPDAGIDAVTSASDKYYAKQGLVYTYKGGKKINVTYLHVKEWLDCIRNGGTPSCTIDLAFQDTITCLMATKSYQEKRRVKWDREKELVI
jgi:predicted dehydrogenase